MIRGATNGIVLGGVALFIVALAFVAGMRWRRQASDGPTGPLRGFGAFGGRGDPSLMEDGDADQGPIEGYLGHVNLSPLSGNTAKGSITFAVTAGALRINAVVEGATPGEHGLTIQSDAECPATGRIASGHLDPFGDRHGLPNAAERHLGDLGNIAVDADGRGELTLYLHPAAYPLERRDGWRTILGKAVMLHAKRDNGATQPDGGAGMALACGVIVRQGGGPHH